MEGILIIVQGGETNMIKGEQITITTKDNKTYSEIYEGKTAIKEGQGVTPAIKLNCNGEKVLIRLDEIKK